mmetsp:Transcript_16181/g.24404  ORF Transcript_16181/g.24404 Transcript_16181/m.24404 type:complete len:172 (+) Transcript_16181:3-518(+)
MKTALVVMAAVAMACVPPDCDNNDCGSCANACCKLLFELPAKSSLEVAMALNKTIASGGPDGRYFVSDLYEGVSGFAPLPPQAAPYDYIGQAIHTTQKRIFNDTINFSISSNATSVSVVAFSISQIGGALCDAGQNFKNIVTVFKSACEVLSLDSSECFHQHVDGSCPEPK